MSHQSSSNVPKPSLGGAASSTQDSVHIAKRGNSMASEGNNGSSHGGGNAGGFYTTSSFPGLCVTSEEINFLVYRYLQESGK